MRGVYSASYRISALAASKTLMYLTAPARRVVEILSASVTNESNETNEQLLCTLQQVSGYPLGAPSGTAVTAAPHEPGDQAASTTIVANVSGNEPTYFANTEVGREGFSSLGGYYFDPLPEERPVVPTTGVLGLRMINSPTAFDAVVKVTFREIG